SDDIVDEGNRLDTTLGQVEDKARAAASADDHVVSPTPDNAPDEEQGPVSREQMEQIMSNLGNQVDDMENNGVDNGHTGTLMDLLNDVAADVTGGYYDNDPNGLAEALDQVRQDAQGAQNIADDANGRTAVTNFNQGLDSAINQLRDQASTSRDAG